MSLRKGQFIINYLTNTLKIPAERQTGYLFAMLDEEFEEMEHAYRKYVITRIHDPKEWDEAFDLANKMFGAKRKRRKKAKTAS